MRALVSFKDLLGVCWGGGGGHFHWRPYQILEREKPRGIRVSKSGVGAESADREKGIKITENGKMVFKLL